MKEKRKILPVEFITYTIRCLISDLDPCLKNNIASQQNKISQKNLSFELFTELKPCNAKIKTK